MSTKEKTVIENFERRTHDLLSVSSMLMPLAKKILGKKGFVEVDILTNWPQIVGDELAEYVLPQSIDFPKGERNNGVLRVSVSGGGFALELQHREKNVIQKINAYFGYAAVASLRIVQNAAQEYNTQKQRVERVQKNLVSVDEEFYIKDLSAGIKNSALQEILERVGRCIVGHNKGENKK
ncbi:MAG: DUF721 domain-containing protein [Alphaproteobacteria bacterium]|nr:DUF721 domain-containing protein [Alphaproteobacteria bacterium]